MTDKTAAADPAPPAKPFGPRRWLRFSLRTLFIAFTVFCVWLGMRVERGNRQRRAVEDLQALGARVLYAHQIEILDGASVTIHVAAPLPGPAWLRRWTGDDFFQRAVLVSFNNQEAPDIHAELLASLPELELLYVPISWANDEDLLKIARLKELKVLDLNYTAVTDEGLAHLTRLRNLRDLSLGLTAISDAGCKHLAEIPSLYYLNLSATDVSDAGLAHLASLDELRGLTIFETNVSDAGLVHLASMPRLRALFLSGTNVTDAGLRQLGALSELESLTLDCTAVTDAGLDRLVSLTKLRTLNLWGTQVTEAGAARLRRALPFCTIQTGPGIVHNSTERKRGRPPG